MIATAIILFGAVSQRAERSIVTPPIWFVGVGFVICGHGLGWFGPRGLASMLFVLVVVDRGRLAGEAYLHAIVMITVLLSTLAHGISAYPLARRYGGYIARVRDNAEVEHTSVLEMPVRMRHVRHHADV